MNRAFSEILILVILVIIAVGVIFAWSYWWTPMSKKIEASGNLFIETYDRDTENTKLLSLNLEKQELEEIVSGKISNIFPLPPYFLAYMINEKLSVFDLKTKEVKEIAKISGEVKSMSATPEYIVYLILDRKKDIDECEFALYAYNLKEKVTKKVDVFEGYTPPFVVPFFVISPNHKFLAYIKGTEKSFGGSRNIYLYNLATQESRLIYSHNYPTQGVFMEDSMRWTLDESGLIFSESYPGPIGYKFYRIKKDGNGFSEISEEEAQDITVSSKYIVTQQVTEKEIWFKNIGFTLISKLFIRIKGEREFKRLTSFEDYIDEELLGGWWGSIIEENLWGVFWRFPSRITNPWSPNSQYFLFYFDDKRDIYEKKYLALYDIKTGDVMKLPNESVDAAVWAGNNYIAYQINKQINLINIEDLKINKIFTTHEVIKTLLWINIEE